MSAEESLLRLKQYSGDGGRAPHKPLLVLLALSRFLETGSSRLDWSSDSDRLSSLIAEFGPPSRTARPQSAAYPFTRLRSDGVWELSTDVPMDNVGPLRSEQVSGHFTSAIEEELRRHPDRIPGLARRIVDLQFPGTIAPDVLMAVGFDPDAVGQASSHGTVTQEVRRRSSAWRANVLAAWDASCAFCGFDGSLGGAPVGIEAAHVRWFNFEGPDEPDNGLALCSLHHKLFDRGALGLTEEACVQVSTTFRAGGPGRAVYELHGRRLEPRPGTPLPATKHVAWHTEQVFRGDPLSA